jgi:hypothetical protein
MTRRTLIALAFGLLSVPAFAQQTTNGFDTANGTDLIFANNGTQVGDWNTAQLTMTTGLSAVQVVSTQTGSGNFRMLSQAAPNGFGSFFYNDSNGTYLLLTNNNDSLGNANNLRPFSVNDTTGTVTLDDGGYGKVGVNTDTPQTELDVNGGIRSGYDGNNCSGNNEGTQRYNTSIHNYEYCNGSSWQPLGYSSAVTRWPTSSLFEQRRAR